MKRIHITKHSATSEHPSFLRVEYRLLCSDGRPVTGWRALFTYGQPVRLAELRRAVYAARAFALGAVG